MPDTRPRYPEETDMNLTMAQRRHVSLIFARARWLLVAKVVTIAKLDTGDEKTAEILRLQERFEQVIKSLPVWLRSERVLSKHVVEPAERRYLRVGILQSARDLRALSWTV